MILDAIAGNINLVVAALVALSVFLTCLAVSWPYLAPDILAMRVRRLADEREAIRVQQPSLRTEPKKLFKDIFERLNLAKQAEDGAVVQSLRMAGYRGRGPVVTFIAVRVVSPLLLFTVTAFYVFVVLDLPYPPQVKLCIVIGAALLGYYVPAIYVKKIGRAHV